eukprot:6532625-Karenia_brevis.AAC.1
MGTALQRSKWGDTGSLTPVSPTSCRDLTCAEFLAMVADTQRRMPHKYASQSEVAEHDHVKD